MTTFVLCLALHIALPKQSLTLNILGLYEIKKSISFHDFIFPYLQYI